MKTYHGIIEQYARLVSRNFELLKDARWKSMNAKDEKTAAKYEQLRQHYARRSETIRNAFMSSLSTYGAKCRALGMRWDELAEEYV